MGEDDDEFPLIKTSFLIFNKKIFSFLISEDYFSKFINHFFNFLNAMSDATWAQLHSQYVPHRHLGDMA